MDASISDFSMPKDPPGPTEEANVEIFNFGSKIKKLCMFKHGRL